MLTLPAVILQYEQHVQFQPRPRRARRLVLDLAVLCYHGTTYHSDLHTLGFMVQGQSAEIRFTARRRYQGYREGAQEQSQDRNDDLVGRRDDVYEYSRITIAMAIIVTS